MAVSHISTIENIRTLTDDPWTITGITIDSSCKGLTFAAVHGTSVTDHIVSVVLSNSGTGYSQPLRRIVTTGDSTTEPGRVDLWYLQRDVPSGSGYTLTVDLASSTGDDFAGWITQYASSNGRRCVPIVWGSQINDAANPSISLDSGPWSTMRMACIYSGLAAPSNLTPNGSMTAVHDHDFGAFVARIDRQTSPATGSVAMSYTASSDDLAFVAWAMAETFDAFDDMVLEKGSIVRGYWPMHEASGTVAFDFSGFCRSGTYTGSPTLNAGSIMPSGLGTSVQLNGTSQYVSIAHSTAFNFLDNAELSLMIIDRPQGGTDDWVFSKAAASNFDWGINREDTDNFYFQLWQSGGASRGVVLHAGTAVEDANYLIGITLDDSPDSGKFYLNGVVGTETTSWAGSSSSGTAAVNIGRRADGTGPHEGQVAKAAIWGGVLSQSDWDDLQNIFSPPPQQDVTGTFINNGYSIYAPTVTLQHRWSPLGLSNQMVWLDSASLNGVNGAAVSLWHDLSGNGRDYSAVNPPTFSGGAAPSGRGAVDFDNVNDRISNGSAPALRPDLTGATFIASLRRTDPSTTDYEAIFVQNNLIGLFISNGSMYLYPGGGSNADISVSEDVVIVGTLTTGGSIAYFINGTPAGTSSLTPTTNSWWGQFVGGHATGSGELFDGPLYGINVFDTVLTTEQRQKLEGWHAWRYGFQTSLPADHPWRNIDPAIGQSVVIGHIANGYSIFAPTVAEGAGSQNVTGAFINNSYSINAPTITRQERWTPQGFTDLLLWLDAGNAGAADAQAVASWLDMSGNGNDYIQGTGSLQPVIDTGASPNGRQGVLFDATDDSMTHLSSPVLRPDLTGYTFICVFRPAAADSSNSPNSGYTNIWSFDLNNGIFWLPTTEAVEWWSEPGSSSPRLVASIDSPEDTVSMFSLVVETSWASAAWVNGAAAGTGAAFTSTEDHWGLYIGDNPNQEPGDGHFFAFIVVERAVTTVERQRLEGYLAWRYGLQTSLPADHQWRNINPAVGESVMLGNINNSYSIYAPTITPIQGVTGAFINNSYTINAPTVANRQIITGAFINNGYTINAPTVGLSVALPVISNGYQIFAPTVHMSVALPTIANSYTINAPTITSVAGVSAAFINNSYQIFAPTVINRQIVTGAHIANGYQIFAPTLRMSVQMPFINNGYLIYTPSVRLSVALPFINNGYTINAPHVKLSVVLPSIGNGYTINAPTVINRQVVDIGHIANGYSIYDPVVSNGTAPVVLGFISNPPTLHAPTVLPQGVTVSLPFINNAPTLFAPSITPGQVTVSLPHIANGYLIYTPSVRLSVAVPFIANSYAIYAPSVRMTVALDFIANGYLIYGPSIFAFGQTLDLTGITVTARISPAPKADIYLSPVPLSTARIGAEVKTDVHLSPVPGVSARISRVPR